jgi:hypothetical protein|nr:MAG TPA: hypothetical protein [Caudoviricetes sp.]
MAQEFKTILLTKESWMNSQLSVAKYSGGVQVTGEGGETRTLLIVNKEGKDLTQVGIPEGEPADLVDKEFIPLYKKLGRDLFIAIVNANPLVSRGELKNILTAAADVKKRGEELEKKVRKEKEKRQNPSFFD